MDVTQTSLSNPLFNPKFINFDYIFGKIYFFFQHLFDPVQSLGGLGTTVKFIMAIFAIFFIFIIVYCFIRLLEIRKKTHEYYHHEIEAYKKRHAEEDMKKAERGGGLNKRWDIVLQYLFSLNPGDWKLAVLEADNMLDGLMDTLGFKGENLGEKLKSVDKDKYPTLVLGWEPHIVRNKIAHEGADFGLSQHEAKRIIGIYEQIFKEFNYI